jgi:hypothetical protein
MGSLKYFRFTLPFFRIATSASGALCLSAFYHLDLKFDVSHWACNEAHPTSRAICMTPHRVHVMHHFSATVHIWMLSLVRGWHSHQTAYPPPLGAAMAFRIAGTEFVLSHYAGLFRKDEHHVPPATAEASLGYT